MILFLLTLLNLAYSFIIAPGSATFVHTCVDDDAEADLVMHRIGLATWSGGCRAAQSFIFSTCEVPVFFSHNYNLFGEMCPRTCNWCFPSESPVMAPTERPTSPSTTPSGAPSLQPIIFPSNSPSTYPPSQAPTSTEPSMTPSLPPSSVPSLDPSTNAPTDTPSSSEPSKTPSLDPAPRPTIPNPSISPSWDPATCLDSDGIRVSENLILPCSMFISQLGRMPCAVLTAEFECVSGRQGTISQLCCYSCSLKDNLFYPTNQPVRAPSEVPTLSLPSYTPSSKPSVGPLDPTNAPTFSPESSKPSVGPLDPTNVPTFSPESSLPSKSPSLSPLEPTNVPTMPPESSTPSSAPTEVCSAITVTCGTVFDGIYFLRDTAVNGRVSWESVSGQSMLFLMDFGTTLSYPGLRWIFTSVETDVMLISATPELEFPSSEVWMELTESMQPISDHTCAGTILCSNIETTQIPSGLPTVMPTTNLPSISPSTMSSPSISPSNSHPTTLPSSHPVKLSFSPTMSSPSISPSNSNPTSLPSSTLPTLSPSQVTLPTLFPSYLPSNSPNASPSNHPISSAPSISPSYTPSQAPTGIPSEIPSFFPSQPFPTSKPTLTNPSISPFHHLPTNYPSNSIPSTIPSISNPTINPFHSLSPTTHPPSNQPSHSTPTTTPLFSNPTASPHSSNQPSYSAPTLTPSFLNPTTNPFIPQSPSNQPSHSAPSTAPHLSSPTINPHFSNQPSYSAPSLMPTFSNPTTNPFILTSQPSQSTPSLKPSISNPTITPFYSPTSEISYLHPSYTPSKNSYIPTSTPLSVPTATLSFTAAPTTNPFDSYLPTSYYPTSSPIHLPTLHPSTPIPSEIPTSTTSPSSHPSHIPTRLPSTTVQPSDVPVEISLTPSITPTLSTSAPSSSPIVSPPSGFPSMIPSMEVISPTMLPSHISTSIRIPSQAPVRSSAAPSISTNAPKEQVDEVSSMPLGLDLTFVAIAGAGTIILCCVFVLICKRVCGGKHEIASIDEISIEDHLVYIKPPLPPAPGLPQPPYYKRSPQPRKLSHLLTDSLVSLDGPKREPLRGREGTFDTGYGGANFNYSDSESVISYGGDRIQYMDDEEPIEYKEPSWENDRRRQPRRLSALLQRSMSVSGPHAHPKREPGARRFKSFNSFRRSTQSSPSEPLIFGQDWFKLSPQDDEYINEGGGPISMSFI